MGRQVRLDVSDEELRAVLNEDEKWLNMKSELDDLMAARPDRLKAFEESKVYAKIRDKIDYFRSRIEAAEDEFERKRDWYLDPGRTITRLKLKMQQHEMKVAFRIEAEKARKGKRRLGR